MNSRKWTLRRKGKKRVLALTTLHAHTHTHTHAYGSCTLTNSNLAETECWKTLSSYAHITDGNGEIGGHKSRRPRHNVPAYFTSEYFYYLKQICSLLLSLKLQEILLECVLFLSCLIVACVKKQSKNPNNKAFDNKKTTMHAYSYMAHDIWFQCWEK